MHISQQRNEVKNHETHTPLPPHDESVLGHEIPRPLCCILYKSTISALNLVSNDTLLDREVSVGKSRHRKEESTALY